MGLLGTGTHVLCGVQLWAYRTAGVTLAAGVISTLTGDMFCFADRGLLSFYLWKQVAATGAALVWRAKSSMRLPVLQRYPDESYRSETRWNAHRRHPHRTPISVRVVVYTLPRVTDSDATYRLVTSILEPDCAPAAELAVLYHERWEIETASDDFETHLRGAQRVLRSKMPELVRQETWGFLLAPFALRALMHEAALGALPQARDPDTLSFIHASRVTRRTLLHVVAISLSELAARPSDHLAGAARRARAVQPRPRCPARRQAQDA